MNPESTISAPKVGSSAGFVFTTPDDAHALAVAGSCACGHAALAAALGRNVTDILTAFLVQGDGLWVNERRMTNAIQYSGASCKPCPAWEATPSVVMIQGLGSWMRPGVPMGARNQRSHWIAAAKVEGDQWVYDINDDDWLPLPVWRATTLSRLLKHWKTESWEVRATFAVKTNSVEQKPK